MNAQNAGSAPPSVLDITAANFEQEVLERSREVPVLVDFWAAWCGPCRTLGPILERLAAELAGRFVLAKIDTEREVELAAAFQIQSIPTVLLIVGGRPVDGFAGALPEAEVRAFLEPYLAAAGEGGAPASSLSPLEQALELEAQGRRPDAIVHLLEHLRGTPGDGGARLALARLFFEDGRESEVADVIAGLTEEDWSTAPGLALRARLDFAANRADTGALKAAVEAEPADIDARLAYGRALVADNQHQEGLEQLLAAARQDLRHDGFAPRKALIEVFDLLGPDDPLTLEYQRRLSYLLCL